MIARQVQGLERVSSGCEGLSDETSPDLPQAAAAEVEIGQPRGCPLLLLNFLLFVLLLTRGVSCEELGQQPRRFVTKRVVVQVQVPQPATGQQPLGHVPEVHMAQAAVVQVNAPQLTAASGHLQVGLYTAHRQRSLRQAQLLHERVAQPHRRTQLKYLLGRNLITQLEAYASQYCIALQHFGQGFRSGLGQVVEAQTQVRE
mmetsp:Transcript_2914/g.4052  ORF Transcript_2914/g.4052 Transcript_2914/m.4052 type:complete len:201 (-) Transcript_2914:2122-2724(-)